ncbi:ribosome biogenesis protein tsr1 [Serendipita vermifera]|nr:ribosome biogenesis protein tsr1 [Serendipita vermifera]
MSTHHHRATLKQQNKPFKSKHATKSSLKEKAKGRIAPNVKRPDPRIPPLPSTAQAKQNRRNHAKQVQKAKRQSLVEATRLFNGVDGAPRIVAVVPLCDSVSSRDTVLAFAKSINPEITEAEEKECPQTGLWRIRAERFRSSLQFILLPYGHFYATLDAAKVADYMILALSTEEEVDSWGEGLLRCLQAQGFPECIAVVPTRLPNADEASQKKKETKSQQAALKSLLSFTKYFVPTLSRVFDLSSASDTSNALRSLCEGKPSDVRWRQGRPYILAENVEFDLVDGDEGKPRGTLKVTGVVRGAPMSANRLVHLQGFGDFQVNRILASPLKPRGAQGDGSMEIEAKILSEPDLERDDLVSTNEVDDMANEQTWPTEAEMKMVEDGEGREELPDAKDGTTPKVIIRVPKGTSAYQAAWLLEDEELESDEDDNQSDEEGSIKSSLTFKNLDGKADDVPQNPPMEEEKEEYEDIIEEQSSKAVAFEDIDMEEEKRQLDDWRARQREHSTHMAFPDEIDTPMNIPARQRFARYRGLKSFRTSPWDPDENLPRDYAKIFRVGEKEWDSASKRIVNEGPGEGVEPGNRVTVDIANVPKAVVDAYNPRIPFVVLGLHTHEHKKTVVNFTLQRNSGYSEPVRSKDPLILAVGARRIAVNPIFSQHLRGGAKTTNNVHKFERFLTEGVSSVGTIYGPLTFGKLPVMLFKETSDKQAPVLVATGTLLPPSTTRIIAKRILLTGHPIKIHKRTVTIRYMFFNPEDVAYFKPVQLHTKYGRIGNITESLGTHGYFKAHFDGPVTQMDTVCMALYKRVYPKWSSEWQGEKYTGEYEEMEQ